MPYIVAGGSASVDGEYIQKNDMDEITAGNRLLDLNAEQDFRIIVLEEDASLGLDDYDGTVADIFSDSNGYDNTVETGSTTSLYDSTNKFYYNTINDDASGDTTSNPDGFTNPSNAFDGNDSTKATDSSKPAGLGKTFSEKTVNGYKWKAEVSANVSTVNFSIKLQTYDGSSWNDEVTLKTGSRTAGGTNVYEGSGHLGKSCQGIRVLFSQTGGSGTPTWGLYTLEYGDYNSTKIKINLPTLTGMSKAFLRVPSTDVGNGDDTFKLDEGSGEGSAYNANELVDITEDDPADMFIYLGGKTQAKGYILYIW